MDKQHFPTSSSVKDVKVWLAANPGRRWVDVGPAAVIRRAWADSGIANIGAPEFGDVLWHLGHKPVELPAIHDPNHTRDMIPQWEITTRILYLVGGSDDK